MKSSPDNAEIQARHYDAKHSDEWEPCRVRDVNGWLFMHQEVLFRRGLGDLRGKRVLDFGCGDGRWAIFMAKSGATVTAIDIGRGNTETTDRNCEHYGVQEAVTVRHTTLKDAGFATSSFDFVLVMAIIHHMTIEEENEALQEIQRVLKDGNPDATSPIDLEIAVNPEFLREGTALEDFFSPDRIVLGVESDRGRDLLLQIYRPLLDRLGSDGDSRVIVTDTNTAEIIKHASNAFLATKISFINMIADVCEASGADVEAVAQGTGMDPRIGAQFLNAGIGYGGYCLPKDLLAFTRVAEQNGVEVPLLKDVVQINNSRVDRFLAKVRKALWVVKGKPLAVWGLAFKPGTDDVREAPSLRIVGHLLEEGAQLRLHDPQAISQFRNYFPENPPHLVYCSHPEQATEGAEALLVLTEWPEFKAVDLAQVREAMTMPVIVDGRNLFDPATVRGMGFDYYGVGRP